MPISLYTIHTNFSNGLTSFGSSPAFKFGKIMTSPNVDNTSTILSVSSSSRNFLTQEFLDIPINLPPQSAPEKLCKPIRALDLSSPVLV